MRFCASCPVCSRTLRALTMHGLREEFVLHVERCERRARERELEAARDAAQGRLF